MNSINIDKPSDVKKAAGSLKSQLVLMPTIAEDMICKVLKSGADKYGAWNWRLTGLEMGTYVSAIKRHLAAIHEGEWIDPESGNPHIAHIAASCCILMDAEKMGCLDKQVIKPERKDIKSGC